MTNENESILRIYKYALNASPSGETIINTRAIVEVLKVDLQDGQPYLWALIDADTPKKLITVICLPTNGIVDKARSIIGEHLGTIVMPSGLVWHFFLQAVDGKTNSLASNLSYALRDIAKLEYAYWLLATLESRQAHGGACFADFDYLSSEENQRIVWDILRAVCPIRGSDARGELLGLPYEMPK